MTCTCTSLAFFVSCVSLLLLACFWHQLLATLCLQELHTLISVLATTLSVTLVNPQYYPMSGYYQSISSSIQATKKLIADNLPPLPASLAVETTQVCPCKCLKMSKTACQYVQMNMFIT